METRDQCENQWHKLERSVFSFSTKLLGALLCCDWSEHKSLGGDKEKPILVGFTVWMGRALSSPIWLQELSTRAPQVPELPYFPVEKTIHTNIYAYIFNSKVSSYLQKLKKLDTCIYLYACTNMHISACAHTGRHAHILAFLSVWPGLMQPRKVLNPWLDQPTSQGEHLSETPHHVHPKGAATLSTNGHHQAACAVGIPHSPDKVLSGVSQLTLLGRCGVNGMFSGAVVLLETQRCPWAPFERIPDFIHPHW